MAAFTASTTSVRDVTAQYPGHPAIRGLVVPFLRFPQIVAKFSTGPNSLHRIDF
jgi:hypothetical protein